MILRIEANVGYHVVDVLIAIEVTPGNAVPPAKMICQLSLLCVIFEFATTIAEQLHS